MKAYLWRDSTSLSVPPTLLGIPVAFDETMPDVAAGTFPIALAAWQKAYVIIERPGMRWLRDPFSAKPYVLFYATKRTGAQSSGDFDALKLLRVGTT